MTIHPTELRNSTVKAKAINEYPGDTRMVLTAPAMTIGGNAIAKGTMYQPQSAGMNGALGIAVRRVFILE